MIKAIIFDFDGTIIDTETAWYQAFRNVYEEHGVELTLDQYSKCVGTSLHSFNPYEYLMTDLNLKIDKQWFMEVVHAQHSSLMELEVLRPGILDYLNMAKDIGLKIGLASSSARPWIDKYLDQLGIKDYFEVIKTADDVAKVKPDPELYEHTLRALGVSAEDTFAIEDSPNGASAAAAAGIRCIIIPNTLTRKLEFNVSQHYIQADSLDQVDFKLMVDRKL